MAQRAQERARTSLRSEPDPHSGHHVHLSGMGVYCSCGEYLGITTIALEERPNPYPRCSICGERGVVCPDGNDDEKVETEA